MTTPHLHKLDFGPEDLPPISPLDLRKAWRAAHVAAEVGLAMEPGDVEGVTFRHRNGAETKFVFADIDAACWAAAVDRTYDLRTVTGLSLLFRLLALIALMADAQWLRPFFSLTAKDGASLDPLLLSTAASQPLSSGAGFNALSFKAAMGIGEAAKLPSPAAKPKAKSKPTPTNARSPHGSAKASRKKQTKSGTPKKGQSKSAKGKSRKTQSRKSER
ncbi:MAG: hypothetical protein JNM81_17390 [Rhodospirillaceae bacterium]|nr:hypothetical protein [Rhodospirillaceae bacterium]